MTFEKASRWGDSGKRRLKVKTSCKGKREGRERKKEKFALKSEERLRLFSCLGR